MIITYFTGPFGQHVGRMSWPQFLYWARQSTPFLTTSHWIVPGTIPEE